MASVKKCSRCGAETGCHIVNGSGEKVVHKNCDNCNRQFRAVRGWRPMPASLPQNWEATPKKEVKKIVREVVPCGLGITVEKKTDPVKGSNGYREHMNSLFEKAKEKASQKREAVTALFDKAMDAGSEVLKTRNGSARKGQKGYAVVKVTAFQDSMAWHLRNRVNNGTTIWFKRPEGLSRVIESGKSAPTNKKIAEEIVKVLGPTFKVISF